MGYELQENERWVEKDVEVEVIEEEGLSNDYRKRDELNIKYYLDLEASVPEWPWPFKKPHEVEGFFKI